MAIVNARPAVLDLPLYEGDDFSLGITFDFDPSDYEDWKGQIRKCPESDEYLEMDVDITDIGNDRVVFTVAGADITAALDGYGYDLEVVTPTGMTRTFLTGIVTVTPQYTR